MSTDENLSSAQKLEKQENTEDKTVAQKLDRDKKTVSDKPTMKESDRILLLVFLSAIIFSFLTPVINSYFHYNYSSIIYLIIGAIAGLIVAVLQKKFMK